MTAPTNSFEIARGHLKVTADKTEADRTLRLFTSETLTQLNLLERFYADSGEDSGERFGEGVRKGAMEPLGNGLFRDANGYVRNKLGLFAKLGEDTGVEIGRGIRKGTERGFGDDSGGGGIFSSLGDMFSSGIARLRNLGGTIRDVGEVFGSIGGFLGGAAKIAGLIALIPVIVAVAAALSKLIGLLGLLPGIIGFAVAAIAPLIVGFKGVGTAIGALVSGDMEKLNEALKKLTPSAQKFVKEFGLILPVLREIKRDTQEALFAPLVGGLRELGKTVLPALRVGMADVAGSLGRMLRGFLDLLASKPVVEAIKELFAATGRIFDRIGPSIVGLFDSFFRVMKRSMPFIERMFDALGGAFDKFSGFLNRAVENGDLERWIEGAISVMKDLWELTKALIGLLGALFGPTADEGQTFIQSLTKMTRELEAFFRSAEGIRFLEDFVALVRNSEPILHAFAAIIIGLVRANNAMVDGIAGLIKWFRNLDDEIDGWLKGAGNAISEWWDTATTKVKELGTTIGTFIVDKAAAFGRWLMDLPRMIHDGLVRAAEAIGFTIGALIGQAVQNIISLPERIRGGLDAMRTMVIAGLEAMTQYVLGLPARWGAALSSLWATVTGWFSRTRESAVSNTRSMSDQVVGWIAGLRQRIMGAIGNASVWLYNAGRDAMRGLIQGFSDMVGWAVDRVRGFADAIVRGFKGRLEARSPSQVMRREVGRTLLPGLIQGMKDDMTSLRRFMGNVHQTLTMPTPNVNVAAPNVSVAAPVFYADFGDGVMRAIEMVAARRPEVFAAGTDEGRRVRNQQLGARAKR